MLLSAAFGSSEGWVWNYHWSHCHGCQVLPATWTRRDADEADPADQIVSGFGRRPQQEDRRDVGPGPRPLGATSRAPRDVRVRVRSS
jgi:hypothetical protein